MMEKPKKERRFLKTLGKIGEILIQEVLLKVGSNLIKRIGGKKTLPSIFILFLSISLFAQYPNTGNKQRLGFQTTADGLVWRGSISDTSSIQPVSNQNAWVILDTVNLKIYSFDFTFNVWNQVGTGGGSAFTQPVDSLFFKTSVPPNNVDTAKMRWDSELGTVVLGMYDAVPNELGFKNFWLVKNQTGSTITKGSIVYANGTVGASGRITVAKFIANGSIDAKYLLGITAHDLSNGEDGYVISFGKIRQVNTDTFAAGAILYPSPTTAGVWTDVEPVAPNLDMPIGFCINSHVNNGTIAIRVASGYKLNELHDVAISSPIEKSSLYYSGGLWRDTTTALLTSDTASMLTNYLRSGVAASTYVPLNTESTINATLNINGNLNVQTGGTITTPILSSGTIIKQGGTTSQFLKANGDVDANSYLRTGLADSSYQLKLTNPITGTGTINYIPKFTATSTLGDANLFTNGNRFVQNEGGDQSFGWDKMGNTSSPFFGNNVKAGTGNERIQRVASTTLFNPSAIIFGYQRTNNSSGAVSFGGINFMTTSGNPSGDINPIDFTRIFIEPDGNIGIGTMQPIYKFDIRGTLGVTGALTVNNATVFNEGSGDFDTRIESDGNANMVFVDAGQDRVGIGTGTPSKTLDVNGEVKIATVTATPTSLLGKDASNVVGEVTTVAQTGLMTRGSTTATTGTPSAVFTVTHGLGSNPTSVIVTGAGASGAQKLIFEVYAKNSTTFSVQVWNYDGTEAASTSVTIYWLAIK